MTKLQRLMAKALDESLRTSTQCLLSPEGAAVFGCVIACRTQEEADEWIARLRIAMEETAGKPVREVTVDTAGPLASRRVM